MHFHDTTDERYDKNLREAAPTAYKGLMGFAQAVFGETDSGLDLRTKELIAVAVAATTQCEHCIDRHVKSAVKAGADEAQVAAAVMISSTIRAGSSYSHGWLAMKMMDDA